jgi:hypothetical protein
MTPLPMIQLAHDASPTITNPQPAMSSIIHYNTFPEAPDAGNEASSTESVWVFTENAG